MPVPGHPLLSSFKTESSERVGLREPLLAAGGHIPVGARRGARRRPWLGGFHVALLTAEECPGPLPALPPLSPSPSS